MPALLFTHHFITRLPLRPMSWFTSPHLTSRPGCSATQLPKKVHRRALIGSAVRRKQHLNDMNCFPTDDTFQIASPSSLWFGYSLMTSRFRSQCTAVSFLSLHNKTRENAWRRPAASTASIMPEHRTKSCSYTHHNCTVSYNTLLQSFRARHILRKEELIWSPLLSSLARSPAKY